MNKPIQIAVLDFYDQTPNEGMRCIREILDDFLLTFPEVSSVEYFDVRAKNQIPDFNNFDIFISSGGPGNPMLTGEAWEKKYLALVDDCYHHNQNNKRKKYLFFICHSFQLVIQHWGLAEVNKRKSTSFGIMPVHKIGMGLEEPLFEGLEEPFYVVDSRDFQVVQPNRSKLKEFEAKVICLEKIRPTIPLERAVMGIRFSDEMIGTQFHPEADAIGMARYLKQEEKKNIVISQYGEEKYNEMIEKLYAEDKIKLTHDTILPKFLTQAIKDLKSSEEQAVLTQIKHQRAHI